MAIKRYEYLVGQRDSSFHTYYYLGVSYYATEKFYEAHDMLEIARKYDPENVNLLYSIIWDVPVQRHPGKNKESNI